MKAIPNGFGKTQLAQKLASNNKVSAISAQRRTWVDDSLPVQQEQQLHNHVQAQQTQWKGNSWQPTEEATKLDPIRDTKLILLQRLWSRLFPKRKLNIDGFFPRVKRLDVADTQPLYELRRMSDGAKIDSEIRKLIQAIKDGVPGSALKEEMLALESRKATLDSERELVRANPPLLHPNMADRWREEVTELRQALEEDRRDQEARQAVRNMVEEIRLTPREGVLSIDVKGNLSAMLAAASQTNDWQRQIALVAGARRKITNVLPLRVTSASRRPLHSSIR